MTVIVSNEDQVYLLAEELASEVISKYPLEGIHGAMHPLRLVALVPNFCKTYNLPITDFLLAAAFHDIGRIDDEEDDEHGRRSAEMLKTLHPEASELTLDLISNHCRSVGDSAYPTELEYFKDLDAIDRQRYGEAEIMTIRITKELPYWLELNKALLPCNSWEEICENVDEI